METQAEVPKDWSLQCGHCSAVFADLTILNVHEKEHVLLKPFRCMLCSDEKKSSFSSLSLCSQHLSEHGKGCVKLYGCGLCHESQRSFVDEISLFRHLNLHHTLGGKIFLCSVCRETYADLRLYLRHMSKAHSVPENENAYICGVCTAEYGDLVSFTEHQLARHGKFVGQEPFKCRQCGKAFWDTYSRTRHEYTHSHDAPFVCKGCNRRFPEETNLRVHLKSASGQACRVLMPEKPTTSKRSDNPGSLQILLNGVALPHSVATEGILLCELCGHKDNEESFEKHSHVLHLPRSPQGTNAVFTPDELKRMVHADPSILQNPVTHQPDSTSSPLSQLAEIALTSTHLPPGLNVIPPSAPNGLMAAPSNIEVKDKKKGSKKSKMVSPEYSEGISDEDKEMLKLQTVSDSDLNEKIPPPPYSILTLLDIYPVRRFTPHLKTKLVMLLSKYAIIYVHRIVSVCAICTSVFDDVQEYKRHALKHKGGSRDMKVPPENLITGIFKEDDETMQGTHVCGIVCLHCLQPFVNFYDFYQHVKKTCDGWVSGCIHGLLTYAMDPCLETLKGLQSPSKQPKAYISGTPAAAVAAASAAPATAATIPSNQPQFSEPAPPVGNMMTIKYNLQKIQHHLSKMKSSHGAPSPPAASTNDNSTLLGMLQSKPLNVTNTLTVLTNSGQSVQSSRKAIRRFKSNKIKASEISQATVDAARGKLSMDKTKVQAKNVKNVSDKTASPKQSIAMMLQCDSRAQMQQMVNLEDNIVRSCLTPSHENTKSQPNADLAKNSPESKTSQSGLLQDGRSEVPSASLAADTSTSSMPFDNSPNKSNTEKKIVESSHGKVERTDAAEMVDQDAYISTKEVNEASVQLPPQRSDSLDERTAFALELTSVKVTRQPTESSPKPSADALSEVHLEPASDVHGVGSISGHPKEIVKKEFSEHTVSEETVQHQESPVSSVDNGTGVSKRTRKKPKRFLDMEEVEPAPKKRSVDNGEKTNPSIDKVGNNKVSQSSTPKIEQKANKKRRKGKKPVAQKSTLPSEISYNDFLDNVKEFMSESSSDNVMSSAVCSDSDATVEFCSQDVQENTELSEPEEQMDNNINNVDFSNSQENNAPDSNTGMNVTEKTVQEDFCSKGSENELMFKNIENETMADTEKKACEVTEENTKVKVTSQEMEKLSTLSPESGQALTKEEIGSEDAKGNPSVIENGFDKTKECIQDPALVEEGCREGNTKPGVGRKRKGKRKSGPWKKAIKMEEISKLPDDQNAGVSSTKSDDLVSDDLVYHEPLMNTNNDQRRDSGEKGEKTDVDKRPVEDIFALQKDDIIDGCRPLDDKLNIKTSLTTVDFHGIHGDCSLLDKRIAVVKLHRLDFSYDAAQSDEQNVEITNVEVGLDKEPVLEESGECPEETVDASNGREDNKSEDSLSITDKTPDMTHLSFERTEEGGDAVSETVPVLNSSNFIESEIKDKDLPETHHSLKDDSSCKATSECMEVSTCGKELEQEEPSTVVNDLDADMEYPCSTSEMFNKKANVSDEYSENEEIAPLSSTSASSEDVELKFYKIRCERLEEELHSVKKAVGKTLVNGSGINSNYLNDSEEVSEKTRVGRKSKRGKATELVGKKTDAEKYHILEIQNANLMQENAELEKNITDIEEKYEKLQTSQEEEKKVLEKCASLEKANECLSQKTSSLETLLKSSCESHLQKLQLVKSRVNDFEKRNATLQVKHKEIEDKLDQCLLVASGARRDRNEMNERFVNLKRAHDAAVREKESTEASYVQQKKQLSDVRTDVLKLIQMLDGDLVRDVGEHLERVDQKLKTVILHLKE